VVSARRRSGRQPARRALTGPSSAVLALAAVLSPAAVLGCDVEPVTEIVIVVDTDLDVPAAVDAIRITVSDADETMQEATADLAAGAPRPVTLGLVSSTGTGTLEVVAAGEREGVEIIRRTARVSFVTGRTLVYRMDLWSRCMGVLCGAERSCGDAGCRSHDVDPAELVDWNGAPPGPPDATAEPDAGVDDGGRFDSGAAEAGIGDADVLDAPGETDAFMPDTGPPDTGPPVGCSAASECDDGRTCTLDECTDRICVHTPRDTACDDGIPCTTDRCDIASGCQYVADDGMCDDGIECMIDRCDRLYGCMATPSDAVCGAGGTCSATGCVGPPRFGEVYTTIIAPRCGPCHITDSPPAGMLPMGNESIAYTSMVGVVARCGGGANTLVIPGDAARSLLWRKVSDVDLCGQRMPRMDESLSASEIDLIARWINGGALE
jgi:hypothetical protein